MLVAGSSKNQLLIILFWISTRRIKMNKYNESWAQVNRPAKKSVQLVPMLILTVAVLIIISLQLIHNCGGV
jgi:hypothetical protein